MRCPVLTRTARTRRAYGRGSRVSLAAYRDPRPCYGPQYGREKVSANIFLRTQYHSSSTAFLSCCAKSVVLTVRIVVLERLSWSRYGLRQVLDPISLPRPIREPVHNLLLPSTSHTYLSMLALHHVRFSSYSTNPSSRARPHDRKRGPRPGHGAEQCNAPGCRIRRNSADQRLWTKLQRPEAAACL